MIISNKHTVQRTRCVSQIPHTLLAGTWKEHQSYTFILFHRPASIAYKLSNSRWVALASSLLAAFNPYILGQSQQWHRHVLGIIVLLAYLCEAKPLHRAITLAIVSLS
jgi:hypothetical protein